jgi:hypothetical protein
MKTFLLYLGILVGVPNFVGLLVGFPLAMLLGLLFRLISPGTSLASPLMSISGGLPMGVGCGVVGIAIARLLGQVPNGAITTISSGWALVYYYSRRQPKVEAWAYVCGIYFAFIVYWIWQPL